MIKLKRHWDPSFLPIVALSPEKIQVKVETASVRVPSPTINEAPTQAVQNLPLNNSNSDASQIIAYMNKMALKYGRVPYVRQAATLILGRIGNNDRSLQLHRIIDFVKSKVIYVRDPYEGEFFMSPVFMLDAIDKQDFVHGDCDDHVLLCNALLNSIGFETMAVAVKLFNREYYDHVISSVYFNHEWIDVDLCAKTYQQPNYTEKLINYET